MKRWFNRQAALALALALLLSLAGLAESLPEAPQVYAAEESGVEVGLVDLMDPAIHVKNAEGIPNSLKLGVKETFALKVKKAKFTSSKPSVAAVSAKGVITAKKQGSATITVTKDGKKLGACKVKVLAAPRKVTLSRTSATLKPGGTLKLKAKLPAKTASNKLTWSSSKKSVAKVDANGKVTAVKAGQAKITVKTFNGRKASCVVTVKKAATPTPPPTQTPTPTPTPVPPPSTPVPSDYVIVDGVITGYSGPGGDIRLPEEDGMGNRVTGIGKGAFKGNSAITSVVVSRYVVSIAASAFEDCASLTSVTMPGKTAEIDEAAFKNCVKLTCIKID